MLTEANQKKGQPLRLLVIQNATRVYHGTRVETNEACLETYAMSEKIAARLDDFMQICKHVRKG